MSKLDRAFLEIDTRRPLSKTRRLPVKGEVLVRQGDIVMADTVIARAEVLGYPVPINVASKLGVEAPDTSRYTLKKIGESVRQGEVLARRKILLGLSEEVVKALVDGTVESISDLTGVVVLRTPPTLVNRLAHIAGEVVEILPGEGCVVRAEGAFVQGLFGVGGEVSGSMHVVVDSPDALIEANDMAMSLKDKIVVGGGGISVDALHRAHNVGVRGIIVGGICDRDLADFLGTEIGLAITGQEMAGLTIIVTDGFGEAGMSPDVFALLKQHEGEVVSINGTTHMRAEPIRPEIIIPLVPSAVKGGPAS